MCGIAGAWHLRPDLSAERLTEIAGCMQLPLHHRGPDGRGCWIAPEAGIALAHRRLSIIDLSQAGQQPMSSPCDRWTLVYNGEIYNHKQLRDQLTSEGFHFRGRSDTEVLLNACAAWGPEEACRRSIGMFAFAFWDGERRELSLGRDRLGIKPLYVASTPSLVLFASELSALLQHPEFSPEVDRDALAAYLRRACFPGPFSVFRDVSKLAPGTIVTISQDGASSSRAYWELERVARTGLANREQHGTDIEIVDEAERLLASAVKDRLIADVPLGAFLSGGIDSSLTVALMQEASTQRVRTYSIGSEDPGYDEASHARSIAAYLGTDHTEFVVTAEDVLDAIPKLPYLLDEPFGDPTILPTYLLSGMARREVTVALTGDGGDEVFGGYTRHLVARSNLARMLALPRPVRRATSSLVLGVAPTAWDRLGLLIPARRRPPRLGEQLHKAADTLTARDIDDLYARVTSVWRNPEEVAIGSQEPSTWRIDDDLGWLTDPMERMLFRDTSGYLADDALTKLDRATMAASLEGRVPLIDHRLVEYSWSLPPNMKIRDGRSKWLLRQVLDRRVPRALVDRPKQGFGLPIGRWLRGPLRPWAEELLAEPQLRRGGYLEPRAVRRSWSEHLSGRRDRTYELWNVLVWQGWASRNGLQN